jgi:hypothetical protein
MRVEAERSTPSVEYREDARSRCEIATIVEHAEETRADRPEQQLGEELGVVSPQLVELARDGKDEVVVRAVE